MAKDNISNDIAYLNSERIKLWERLVQLEDDINKKSSDYEKEAKQSSRKATEFKNRSNEAKDISIESAEISHQKSEEAKQYLTHIKTVKTKADDLFKKIEEFNNNISARSEGIEETITTLEENFDNYDLLTQKLDTLKKHFDQGHEINGKIDTLYKSIQTKKREIDGIYREVFGYIDTETDEDGHEIETTIEGLKDQLEATYENLKNDLDEFVKDITSTKKETLENYNSFIFDKDSHYQQRIESWNKDYDLVLEQIKKLLPNALTTGLSYAYSEKKESEVEESKKFAATFRIAALGLAAVSLIPFALSIFFIFEKKTLIEVLEYSPRFVLAIIPLYIPILWIAYSANKKLNLSKRLIEEYTHKEVLSKTFEGLSHQINSIEDEETSNDLRIKLLYNILSVSSENPGKLISDYNKSDHPVMDALEKSANLSDAVEKLENIPGLSKLAKILDNKSKKIVKEQAEKVNATLGEIAEEILDEEE